MSDQRVGPQTQQRDLFCRAASGNQCPVDSCPAVLNRRLAAKAMMRFGCSMSGMPEMACHDYFGQKHGIFSNNSCRGKTDKVHPKHVESTSPWTELLFDTFIPPALRTGLGRLVVFLIAIILKTS